MTEVKQRKSWRMSCDVGEVTEMLKNELCFPSVALRTSQLILQPFIRFSYVTGSSLTSPGEPPMVRGEPSGQASQALLVPFTLNTSYFNCFKGIFHMFIYVLTSHDWV